MYIYIRIYSLKEYTGVVHKTVGYILLCVTWESFLSSS